MGVGGKPEEDITETNERYKTMTIIGKEHKDHWVGANIEITCALTRCLRLSCKKCCSTVWKLYLLRLLLFYSVAVSPIFRFILIHKFWTCSHNCSSHWHKLFFDLVWACIWRVHFYVNTQNYILVMKQIISTSIFI